MKLLAVRGAITVPENAAECIAAGVEKMINTLMENNQIEVSSIVSLFFTTTADVNALNPATGLRHTVALHNPAWNTVPLLCSQEPDVPNMLPLCIRVLIQWQVPEDKAPSKVQAAYLEGAAALRPDLLQ